MALTRGRRLTLALGLPFALASIGYAGLNYVSLVAQAKYQLRPVALPAGAAVQIDDGSGDLTVVPSPDRYAHLQGTVYYSLVHASVSRKSAAGHLVVQGPNCFWIGSCGANLQFAAPAGARLTVALGDGSLVATDVNGSLRLRDSSGGLTLRDVSGSLILSDSSGDITATGLGAATVTASDSSGNVDLSFTRAPDYLAVHDASGDINIAVPGNIAYQVTVETDFGSKNIDVPTNPSSEHVIKLSANSGNVSVVPAAG